MTPSQTAPKAQTGDHLVAAIEAQTVAIERAMVGARAKAWVEVYLEKARPHLVVGRDPDILFLTVLSG